MGIGKLKKRNRRKYDQLLKNAKRNDLALSNYIELVRRMNELQRSRRLSKRYGEVIAWDELDTEDDFMWTVPIYLEHKGEIIGYRAILNKKDLPEAYHVELRSNYTLCLQQILNHACPA